MINKIKDLVYDFNDIVIALLILAVAAGVISWRVADIMAYPEYLARQQGTEAPAIGSPEVDFTDFDLTQNEQVDPNLNENPDNVTTDPTPVTPETPPVEETPIPASSDVKVTIPSGSYAAKIAEILYTSGVVTSKEAFLNTLTDSQAKRLKAGDFTIPAGSTIDQIIEILTK